MNDKCYLKDDIILFGIDNKVTREDLVSVGKYLIDDLNLYLRYTPITNGQQFDGDHIDYTEASEAIIRKFGLRPLLSGAPVRFVKHFHPQLDVVGVTSKEIYNEVILTYNDRHTQGPLDGAGDIVAIASKKNFDPYVIVSHEIFEYYWGPLLTEECGGPCTFSHKMLYSGLCNIHSSKLKRWLQEHEKLKVLRGADIR